MKGCFSLFRSSSHDEAAGRCPSIASSVTLAGPGDDFDQEKQSLKTVPGSTAADSTTQRLIALRKLMADDGIDIYIVPNEDPHGSEYTAPRDQVRAFISNFTGSAGTAIIGSEQSKFAGLWTDSRYYTQAEDQLDDNWKLFKQGLEGVPNWTDWITKDIFRLFGKDSIRVGLDSRLFPYTTIQTFLQRAAHNGFELVDVFAESNLVAKVWTDPDLPFHKDYPRALDEPIHEHPLKYAGNSAEFKLSKVLQWLNGASLDDMLHDKEPQNGGPKRATYYVVNSLDETAWLLNLRGMSIPYNPVFPSYVILGPSQVAGGKPYWAKLFIPPQLLPEGSETYKYLVDTTGIEIGAYDDFWSALSELSGSADDDKVAVGSNASYAVVQAASADRCIFVDQSESPISFMKAVKNATEIQGMRNAYLRDGVAWAKWAAWLEESIVRRGRKVTEWAAAEHLIQIRAESDMYAGFEAYQPISGTGRNAALPHYETPVTGSAVIDRKTPYLNDSGGQYFDGTIDCTRTVHFGKPTAEQKRAYTRVLQGHIGIDTAIFPSGCAGATIDALARAPLWQDGLTYSHGTGHGFGSFINVHEGPSASWFFSPTAGKVTLAALRPGMCLTNEPGYYKPTERDGFGIRIETALTVREVQPAYAHADASLTWYGFERLTRVPIATNLIEWSLLDARQKEWVRAHNESVKRDVMPLLGGDKRARKWLAAQ